MGNLDFTSTIPVQIRSRVFQISQMGDHEHTEMFKQTCDEHHPLHDVSYDTERLKSRKKFLNTELSDPPIKYHAPKDNPQRACIFFM